MTACLDQGEDQNWSEIRNGAGSRTAGTVAPMRSQFTSDPVGLAANCPVKCRQRPILVLFEGDVTTCFQFHLTLPSGFKRSAREDAQTTIHNNICELEEVATCCEAGEEEGRKVILECLNYFMSDS